MLEVLFEALKGPIGVLVAPVSASFMGWAKNAVEDGKIDGFEIKMLAQTVLAVSIPALGVYYGLNMAGFDAPGFAAGFVTFLPMFIMDLVHKKKHIDSKKIKK